MSITYKNDCCGCAVPGYPCLGNACPNRNAPHYFCDECKDEFSPKELHQYDEDTMLCEKCLLGKFEKVRVD